MACLILALSSLPSLAKAKKVKNMLLFNYKISQERIEIIIIEDKTQLRQPPIF
jgi:hypothetical protein